MKFREFLQQCQMTILNTRCSIYVSQLISLVDNSDIEGYHRIGKGNSQTLIVRFVKRKFCNLVLDKKHELKKIGNAKLCLQINVKLFPSKNLSTFYQRLAWKCRELKRASKIHSAFRTKDIVKIRHTMNE